MDRLYVYHGIVSSVESYGSPRKDIVIVLRSPAYEIAPAMLNVYGSLAEYIRKIEMTDVEERYLYANYYFNDNLRLHLLGKGFFRPSPSGNRFHSFPDGKDRGTHIQQQYQPLQQQVSKLIPRKR